MSKFPITIAGADMLRTELHRLKTIDRPGVIAAIAEARSHGDLSENAEYDAAKERQGFIEGRIKDVEGKLGNAQIIDPKLLDADGRVVFGATVELEDLQASKPVCYQIVGDHEADIKAFVSTKASTSNTFSLFRYASGGAVCPWRSDGRGRPCRSWQRRLSWSGAADCGAARWMREQQVHWSRGFHAR